MGKDFTDFITLDRKDSNLDPQLGINKINYQKILYNTPIPMTLWELKGEDFLLVYSNKAAEEIIEPKLSLGIQLSTVLPSEHKNIFSHISSYDGNNSSAQIMIDKNLLLIVHNGLKRNLIKQIPNQKLENYKKEPFRTILEQSPVSIIIIDIQGNIEYINPKFVEITGYSPNEVIGKNPRILNAGNKSSEEYKKLWDTILSGNVWKGEFINKRKNGELYYEFAIISPIKDLNGAINNFIVIKEDITKLKEADNKLRKSEKFAALGKMSAYLAHEIKSPLS
ncbi:MAG: PAS domain S-box protein, partial [Ignavibacteriaceae bacterium]